MSGKVQGNKTLSGTWGELWVDGEKVWEMSKVTAKVTANREDVQMGLDVDSKMTGLKGEFTIVVKKVYSRYVTVFENWKKGIDQRCQLITKLADPDAVGEQQERYSIDNAWFNELPLVDMEKGGIIEEEVSGGFTPTDMVNLDRVA